MLDAENIVEMDNALVKCSKVMGSSVFLLNKDHFFFLAFSEKTARTSSYHRHLLHTECSLIVLTKSEYVFERIISRKPSLSAFPI